MPSIYDWDLVASNNATADPDLTWAEGQAPSSVNDSARTMMKRNKELLVDLGGSLVAGGTANALTVTAQSAFTSLADGRIVSFRAISANTASSTLNANGISVKLLVKSTDSGITALSGGELQVGSIYTAQYSTQLNSGAGAWLLLNPTPLSSSFFQPGMLIPYTGFGLPAGWLLCYGQGISRTTYAALFAVIGTVYGPGDGSTTFNLPDLRGRVIAAPDNMGGFAANRLTAVGLGVAAVHSVQGGSETQTLTIAQMPAHAHTGVTDVQGVHTHNTTMFNRGDAGSPTANSWAQGGPTFLGGQNVDASGAHGHNVSLNNTGGGTAHPNVQPTYVFNTLIKF